MRLQSTILLAVLFAASSCSFDSEKTEQKLKSSAAELSKQALTLYQDSAQPQLASAAESAQQLSESVAEIKQTRESINNGIESTEQTIEATKTKAKETKKAVRKRVRVIMRRLPRSREEANRLAYDKGKYYLDTIQARIDDYLKENGSLAGSKK